MIRRLTLLLQPGRTRPINRRVVHNTRSDVKSIGQSLSNALFDDSGITNYALKSLADHQCVIIAVLPVIDAAI
jgi:hypothetical protein